MGIRIGRHWSPAIRNEFLPTALIVQNDPPFRYKYPPSFRQTTCRGSHIVGTNHNMAELFVGI